MSTLATNAITDASGGNTASINGYTPTMSNMAGRNLIINGAMQVAQRGTSGTNSSSGYGIFTSVDRWAIYYNGTRSQQLSEVINGAYTYYLKIDGNTAPANLFFYQKIEFGSRLVSGKEVTLSFLAKSSNSTAMRIRARFYDSATQNNVSETAIGVASLTNTWTSYSYTFTPTDSSANLTRDLMLLFDCDGGAYSTGDDISITGVQLEAGSVATPFEHRHYGQELALCQRYYQKSYDYDTVPGTNTTVGSVTARGDLNSTMSNFPLGTRFVVTMRAVPTLVTYSKSGTSGAISNLGTSLGSQQSAVDTDVIGGLGTTGISYVNVVSATGPGVSMHYTADAEL